MHDQSFNVKTLSRVFHQLDFLGINPLAKPAFRDNTLSQSIAIADAGFSPAANPLVCFPLRGKLIYKFSALAAELVSRQLSLNVWRTCRIRSSGRAQIVKNLRLLLTEGTPCRVYRLDIRSFYESFQSEHAAAKIAAMPDLSPQSKRLIIELLRCHAALGGTGVPRGLSLSANLSEYFMQDFDAKVSDLEEVFFYSRYVDDFIVITSAREDEINFLRQVERALPPGLFLNTTKTRIVAAENKVEPKKAAADKTLLFDFEYLGYLFSVSDPLREKNRPPDSHFRTVKVDVAHKKVKRFKTRICRSFYDYHRTGDWELLRDRIRFLSKNFSVHNAKAGGTKLAGIYHSYPLAESDAGALKTLDEFLRHLTLSRTGRISSLTSPKLAGWQKRQLLTNSFEKGHAHRTFVHFSSKRLGEIQACWEH